MPDSNGRGLVLTGLSLAVLRRLRFPIDGTADSDADVDLAARAVLAALGLAAGTVARCDVDLRSRCHLFADTEPTWYCWNDPANRPDGLSSIRTQPSSC